MEDKDIKSILDFIQLTLQCDGAIYSFQMEINYCNMYGDCIDIVGSRGRSETIKTEK
jgi:hypothetical protein